MLDLDLFKEFSTILWKTRPNSDPLEISSEISMALGAHPTASHPATKSLSARLQLRETEKISDTATFSP